jgi:hypothetical protein
VMRGYVLHCLCDCEEEKAGERALVALSPSG